MTRDTQTPCNPPNYCLGGTCNGANCDGWYHPCPAGKYGEGCKACAKGFFRRGDDPVVLRCKACANGTFQPKTGTASCLPCTPGKVTTQSGCSHCTNCGVGEFAVNSSSSSCERCPSGFAADAPGSAACTLCKAGKYGNGCLDCEKGQYRVGDDPISTKCKLCEPGFAQPQRAQQLHRDMVAADVPKAHALLSAYLSRFALAPALDPAEFAHWVLPREGVIDAFVVDTPQGEITDLCSFYHLPSTVIGHDKHSTLKAGYSFYNVATSMSLQELMRDALICAKRVDMDVFNALNIMENDTFLKDLKFGIGDGHLQYYLYNWKCAEMTPADIGLVLL